MKSNSVFLVVLSGLWSSLAGAVEFSSNDLKKVEVYADGLRNQDKTPVFIFDLDETLIDTTLRRYLSYRDAISEVCAVSSQDLGCQEVATWNLNHFYSLKNKYSNDELFKNVLVPQSWKDELFKRFWKIYASPKYLDLDCGMPGALQWVKKLIQRSALIYIVSSRSENRLLEGTMKMLSAEGFAPLVNQVLLKPDPMTSIDFKRLVFQKIKNEIKIPPPRRDGGPGFEIAGVFENEPENINALMEIFPTAMAYFVRGAFVKEVPLLEGAIPIDDFYTSPGAL